MLMSEQKILEHMEAHRLEQTSEGQPYPMLPLVTFPTDAGRDPSFRTQWSWLGTSEALNEVQKQAGRQSPQQIWDKVKERVRKEMLPYHHEGSTGYPGQEEQEVDPQFVGHNTLCDKAYSIAGPYLENNLPIEYVARSMALYSHLDRLLKDLKGNIQSKWLYANTDMVEHMLMLASNGVSAYVVQGASISAKRSDAVRKCHEIVRFKMAMHQWLVIPWNTGNHWGGFFYNNQIRRVFYSNSMGREHQGAAYTEDLRYNFLRFLDANHLRTPLMWVDMHVPTQRNDWGCGYHTAMACHALLRDSSGDWHQFFKTGDEEMAMLRFWRKLALAYFHPDGLGYSYNPTLTSPCYDRLTVTDRDKSDIKQLIRNGIKPADIRDKDMYHRCPLLEWHTWKSVERRRQMSRVRKNDNELGNLECTTHA
ncbi:hypothetical protein KJ359_010171 [Pestalotiopsis sp. 9143b]|nr:hypothetical protein KJ359_010171 [Pestalotiopsis sp. 9143b]